MQFSEISVPEIYRSSEDFRFFLDWFGTCLEKMKYDHESFLDLYDPLRCPDDLLWCLADTMGFKYDDRMPVSYNRLILVYFMSMIRLKGSQDGIMLAAEVNLTQFRVIQEAITGYFENDEDMKPKWVNPKPILQSRLENTSIPVQSVSVTPHVEEGYIELVYFSTEKPVDCCIEYVRPVGMYLYQMSGVKFDARTKISIDARLTNINNMYMSIGATHVGHYSREDYARMQQIKRRLDTQHEAGQEASPDHVRRPVNYRNTPYEKEPQLWVNPGYRTLYSLQLANNDHIVNSLIRDPETGELNPPDKIFSIGYNPIEITTVDGPTIGQPVLEPEYADKPLYNLRYDYTTDQEHTTETFVNDPDREQSILAPKPAVNPIMGKVGDAITHTPDNTLYSKEDTDDNQKVEKH